MSKEDSVNIPRRQLLIGSAVGLFFPALYRLNFSSQTYAAPLNQSPKLLLSTHFVDITRLTNQISGREVSFDFDSPMGRCEFRLPTGDPREGVYSVDIIESAFEETIRERGVRESGIVHTLYNVKTGVAFYPENEKLDVRIVLAPAARQGFDDLKESEIPFTETDIPRPHRFSMSWENYRFTRATWNDQELTLRTPENLQTF